MEKPKRFTVTAALPYANGPLHIGHIAGAYLPADIYVRYLRLKGKDVKFICGSDEHGVPITLRAKKEGKSPQEIVDYYHELNKATFKRFGIAFDIYHRTSDKLHHETASEFFLKLYEKGEFTKEESEQYYDEEAKQFLADRYIEGTCPNCSYEHAYGDQCERCGKSLSPSDLINPKSMLTGNAPVLKKTTHWYLPLDKYQEEWLADWIESKKGIWKSNVYGQCKSWIDQKLQPRAVTRDLDWGVPVPLPDAEGKVLYVWFDAPIGYISATKALFQESPFPQGRAGEGLWEKYWKKQEDEADNAELIHFIGKDNIVFHCIIFPAMLKAEGSYILPKQVPANEFLNLEGDKLSTSKNWAIWLHEYLDEFPGKEDVLRYVLCSIMPEQKDSEFTWKDFQARNNNELVATLGNFVNRVFVLVHKHYGGVVPTLNEKYYATLSIPSSYDNIENADKVVFKSLSLVHEDPTYLPSIPKTISRAIEAFNFREAGSMMMAVARLGNKYLDEKKPWKLIQSGSEEDQAKAAYCLNLCVQIIANIAVLIDPLLPYTSRKVLKMLNLKEDFLKWESTESLEHLPSGHKINQPELLFEKIEDDIIQKQIDKLHRNAKGEASQNGTPLKPEISFDDFVKQDIRVGGILSAEKVKGADKLLQLTVDLGFEKRTIVSGIAEFYKPEDIVGKQVSVLANLAPKTIRGVESKGMILMAEDENGKLSFISPSDKMPDGSVIR